MFCYILRKRNHEKAALKMHISSKDNPKIKQYIKLAESKKYRYETGCFVLEGARCCRDAFAQWNCNLFEIVSCFATEKAIEKYSDYINSMWFMNHENFYTIDDSIAVKMSDSQFPQGIFIVAKMFDNSFLGSKLKSKGKYLVLDNVQDPGNVGTLLRTAEAVGIDAAIMCNCCDLYNPKVIRSAVGTASRLNIMFSDDFPEAVKLLKHCGIKVYATVIDSSACSVIQADFNGGVALVLGNEGNGMSDEDVLCCDKSITIKMRGNTNSLNVASAGSIFLWEMCRGEQCE